MNLKHRTLRALILFYPSAATAWTPEQTANCAKPNGLSSFFSRCKATPQESLSASNSNAYCLPGQTPTPNFPTSFAVEKKQGNTYATLSISVKNCKSPHANSSGDFVVAIDNSYSACSINNVGTDCDKHRLVFASKLIAELKKNSSNKVGIVAYGGRQTTTQTPPTYSNDSANQIDPDTEKIACLDKDTATSDRWALNSKNGYDSVCEYKAFNDTTDNDRFINTTGAYPRGSTDYTYMLEAIQSNSLLGGSSKYSKHAIIITDGLPSIPKRIPRSICEFSNILLAPIIAGTTSFQKETSSPFREYCFDRQYREAINQANKYVEGFSPFESQNSSTTSNQFPKINLHNILYITDGLASADVDYATRELVFPDDPLMELSARTGNGQIKFDYINGTGSSLESQETTLFSKILASANNNAVQRVTAEMNGHTFQAISSSDFDDQFDIKIPGITNSGSVTFTVYYGDGTTSTSNGTIVVSEPTTYTTGATCEDMSAGLTIDGESPTSTTPLGDGVLPYTDSNGNLCRVFRNASAYRRNLSLFSVPTYEETKREKAARLRLQGGSASCGNIAGTRTTLNTGVLFLSFIPILLMGLLRRKDMQ